MSDPDVSDLLVVGLGNPGPDYARSRHNVGWICVEELAHRLGVRIDRKRWQSRLGTGTRPGAGRVWLLMPQTMMKALASEDQGEGVNAFRERRAPKWSGR